jgi:hypothetical protein
MNTDAAPSLVETNPEQDRLHAPFPPPPEYSENLILMGYDPTAELGIWVHFSRMHGDADLWEGIFCVYAPDGEVLLHQSYGREGTQDRADTGFCSFEVVEPLQKWRARFDGRALRSTTREAASRVLSPAQDVPVAVDLTFDGVFPTWSAGAAMDDQDWGDSHLEQGGSLAGTIEIDGVRAQIDCMAFRDHTRGTRNYTGLSRHCWTFGFFPSGRVFLVLEAFHDPGDSRQTFGFVVEDGKLHNATPRSLPGLDDCEGAPRDFTIELDSDVGEMTVQAQMLHAMPFTMRAPLAMPLGTDWSDPSILIDVEGPTRVQWNGEEGFGWAERTNRTGRMARPA